MTQYHTLEEMNFQRSDDNDLVIVLLMAAVQHLVRLARSYKLLCVPAELSPCTCDAGASDC